MQRQRPNPHSQLQSLGRVLKQQLRSKTSQPSQPKSQRSKPNRSPKKPSLQKQTKLQSKQPSKPTNHSKTSQPNRSPKSQRSKPNRSQRKPSPQNQTKLQSNQSSKPTNQSKTSQPNQSPRNLNSKPSRSPQLSRFSRPPRSTRWMSPRLKCRCRICQRQPELRLGPLASQLRVSLPDSISALKPSTKDSKQNYLSSTPTPNSIPMHRYSIAQISSMPKKTQETNTPTTTSPMRHKPLRTRTKLTRLNRRSRRQSHRSPKLGRRSVACAASPATSRSQMVLHA